MRRSRRSRIDTPLGRGAVATFVVCWLGFFGVAGEIGAQSVWDEALDDIGVVTVPPGFGDALRPYLGFKMVSEGKLIGAREVAEEVLAEDPDDFAGHFLLGIVLHRAEGSLPRAYYHLRRSRELFERRYGPTPTASSPWRWHALGLAELAYVTGSMGRHVDKIEYLNQRDGLYDPPWPADRGWPLMRLRRYEEAREAAEEGLLLNDRAQQATARTALCAIEAEQHHRQRANDACRAAVDLARRDGPQGPTVFTNAAEAALGVLRFDETERLILEGTDHFVSSTVSNPWMDLLLLYLGQGRVAPGLDALREMFRWRNRQPAFVHEQNRSEIDMAAVAFLLAAGRYEKAVTITERILSRPDRTGFSSSEEDQMTAAAAILDAMAQRLRAVELEESASWLPWRDALEARVAALRHRARAWTSTRRAAARMANARTLAATLRPYLAGSVELPEWLEGELVRIVGPGVMAAALDDARRSETLVGAVGYFDAFSAEIALRQGRDAAAMDLAGLAVQGLPDSELMMQARLHAIGAKAALAAGARERALGFLDRALQLDPGVARTLDIALPTIFEAGGGPVAERALRHLRRSPRFRTVRGGSGFRLRVEADGAGGQAMLLGPRNTVLTRVRVTPRAGEDTEALARRLAAEVHEQAFSPRVDLTETDLRSLDGSPTAAGGRGAERLRTVLDEVVQ